MSEYNLTLKGPYKLFGDDSSDPLFWNPNLREVSSKPGLYFWVVPNTSESFEGDWWVNYVGKSESNISTRIGQHMGGYLGLGYNIYDCKTLKEPWLLAGLKGKKRFEKYYLFSNKQQGRWNRVSPEERDTQIGDYFESYFGNYDKSSPLKAKLLKRALKKQFGILRLFVLPFDNIEAVGEPNGDATKELDKWLLRSLEAVIVHHLKGNAPEEVKAFLDNNPAYVAAKSDDGLEVSIGKIELPKGKHLVGIPGKISGGRFPRK